MIRVCPQVSDCPQEDISGNFSSETDDTLDFISTLFHGFAPPPFLKQWNRTICGVTFLSDISQQDANLRAAAAALSCSPCQGPECQPPPPGTTTFCNAPQTCCFPCGDGTSSCYTVPGGLFCNFNNQQEADSAAHNWACNIITLSRVCISNLSGCTCINTDYSQDITTTSPVSWDIIGGSLPPGMSFSGGFGLTTTISGQATASGQFTFEVRALNQIGVFTTKFFTITVLEIPGTSLAPYTVGTPYSYQLIVNGGSGNYNWAITSGSLPDGLTMSLTGLVTGTPTGANSGVQPITFKVIDLTCEQADQSFFPPRIALRTKSTTQIATLHGYSEYIVSTPPKKYHSLTWQGTSEQTARIFGGPTQIAGAKYVWSGTGTVDGSGVQTSNYRKDFFAACPKLGPWPTIASLPNFGLNGVVGYCWPPDPQSCPACDFTDTNWTLVANLATNSILDTTQSGFNNLLADVSFRVVTPTSLDDSGTSTSQTFFVGGTENLPSNHIQITSVNAYKSQLSNEYTDAEALANALTFVGIGATAQNLPRTTGFVSTFTNVVFTLLLTNLIKDTAYVVSVRFRDNNFNVTTKQYGVQASSDTASITDVIPTPPAGGTITVFSPSVAFAP